PAHTQHYTLSLHDALPISQRTTAPGSTTTRPGTRPFSTVPSTHRPGVHGTRTGGRTPGTPVRKQPERRVPVVKEKPTGPISIPRSEEHTSELQSPYDLVCR